LHADVVVIPPNEFTITSNGEGGWGNADGSAPQAHFDVTANDTEHTIDQFSSSCATFNGEGFNNCSFFDSIDPTIRVNLGGDPTAVEGNTFSFDAQNGDFFDQFFNDSGQTFTNLFFQVTNEPTPTVGEQFTCGGTAFLECGFRTGTDPNGVISMQVFFTNGSIPSVPEPASWWLLSGAVAVVGLLRSKGRISGRVGR